HRQAASGRGGAPAARDRDEHGPRDAVRAVLGIRRARRWVGGALPLRARSGGARGRDRRVRHPGRHRVQGDRGGRSRADPARSPTPLREEPALSGEAPRRLWVIWGVTLAFLPLYTWSGVVLRARVEAGAYGTD